MGGEHSRADMRRQAGGSRSPHMPAAKVAARERGVGTTLQWLDSQICAELW